jgi:hypothetical protein
LKGKLKTNLERAFETYARIWNLPPYETEFHFCPTRKWRFDCAWVKQLVAVELEGGTWLPKSRHTTGVGFEGDCYKYNTAAAMGWSVFRFTGTMLEKDTGACLDMLRDFLKERS